MDLELVRELAQESDSKIVLLVLDGLGGLPHPETGRTELEAAWTPHLDRIAKESVCGFTLPVGIGITPGSGPGHLALFGYDPLVYKIGRGVLEATGIDFDLRPSDVAARGNFCTVDGVQVFVEPVREHRFVLVLRGDGLSDAISDTDPQVLGAKALPARSMNGTGEATAKAVGRWVEQAEKYLADKHPANMMLLRGFAKRPDWPSMPETFGFRAASVAHYPMYRGLAKLVGMEALPVGPTLDDTIATLRENWSRFDYFFVHYKYTDTAGEDGDYDRKMERLTEVDAAIPALMALGPDVLMVGGDHSTPAIMAAHSWHPVPFMLRSKVGRGDDCESFNEGALRQGSVGTIPAKEAMALAMAHAGRFKKYGA